MVRCELRSGNSCGYYLADKGTDLRTMQDYLGHPDPKRGALRARRRAPVRGVMAVALRRRGDEPAERTAIETADGKARLTARFCASTRAGNHLGLRTHTLK